MLIQNGRILDLREGETTCSEGDYTAYWAGLPYWPGYPPGEASIRQLMARIIQAGVLDAAPGLCGHYFVAVVHRPTRRLDAFVDSGGMYYAFRTTDAVGTSFLQLARLLRLPSTAMDPEAIVEFLNLGRLFFGLTFFPQIRRIAWNEVVTVPPGGPAEVLRKPVDDIGQLPREDFSTWFAQLAADFKDERCALDLTGGADSRMLAAIFTHFGLDFEINLSGVPGHIDLLINRELATILGKEPHITYHAVGNLEEDLPRLFQRADGLQDLLSLHRLGQHNRQRAERGVSIAFSGAGGELYKDFFWMQDFPFYNRKRSNLARLFDYRIRPIPFPGGSLAPAYQQVNDGVKSRVLAVLQEHLDSSNTRSYDRIYYYVKTQAATAGFISSQSSIVRYYAPLCEPDLVRTGFHLPRHMRFFNRFHRSVITQYCPSLATVRTGEGGMSASSRTTHQLRDARRFLGNRLVRLTKKLIQRSTGRTYFQQSPDHPSLMPEVMRSSVAHDLVARLRSAGVLAADAGVAQIGPAHIGKVLTLGYLVSHLDRAGVSERISDAASPLRGAA